MPETLCTAGNIFIPVLGIASVNIKLNNRTFTVLAKVIEKLSTDVILGMDSMQENNVLLDIKSRSIIFRDEPSQPTANFCIIADQELPLYDPVKKAASFKLQAADDEIFRPGEIKRILTISARPYRFYYNVLANYKFLESRGLEICSRPKIKRGTVTIGIKSNNLKNSNTALMADNT